MHIRTLTLNPAFDLHYRMESLRVGHENYAQSVTRDAGGKGINTARALTVNGVKCTAFAVLGRDNAAEFEQMLCADRLPYRAVYVPGAIRENMTIHPASGPETRISLDQFSVPPDTLDQLRTRLRPQNPALYFAVQCVLEKNKAERHLRGGAATKAKYQK